MNPVVVLAAFIGLALMFSLGAAPSPVPSYNDEMDRLQKRALDEAFERRMIHLFDVWMAEPNPDVTRQMKGAQKYRDAYTAVRKELDKRAKED